MISLKPYLDQKTEQREDVREDEGNDRGSALLRAYRSCLIEVGSSCSEACAGLAHELSHGTARILDCLGTSPAANAIASSEVAMRDLLRNWGRKTARYHDEKAEETRDLLLVMARTAESLGHNDDRCAKELDSLMSQLESIANLDDVGRIRASVERSAHELKNSIAKMTAESRAVISHLRAEVCTYQARLEKTEHTASCDALTGLGSRYWIENRILQRIDSESQFSIALIDIQGFHRVVENYGNLVGDSLLKEFARELRSSCRFTDIVGRWGGDEFIVVFDNYGPELEAQLARLQSRIAKSYHVPGRTGYMKVQLDVSLGLAEYRSGESLQELLERADAELCSRRRCSREEKTA